MRALDLLAAEWQKTWRRRMHALVVGVPLAIGLVWALYMVVEAAVDPSLRDRLAEYMPWPAVLLRGKSMIAFLTKLTAVLLTASIVGSEYAQDTWKMILPRGPTRGAFLLTKWVLAVACSVGVVSAMLLLACWPPAWMARHLGMTSSLSGAMTAAPAVNATIAVLYLQAVLFVSIALLAATVTRSTLGASALGLLMMFVIEQLAGIRPWLAWVLPSVHVQNLEARLANDNSLLDRAESAFEAEVPALTSAAVLGVYIFGTVVLAMLVFRRRDVASSSGSGP